MPTHSHHHHMKGLHFHLPESVDGWGAIDDRVMGGVSCSRLCFHPDGHAVFEGEVSTKNGGGFASVRHEQLRLGDRGAEGYRLHVRGDGKRYKLNLRTDGGLDGIQYQAAFDLAPVFPDPPYSQRNAASLTVERRAWAA